MPKALFIPIEKTFVIYKDVEGNTLPGLSIEDPIEVTFRQATRYEISDRQSRLSDASSSIITWEGDVAQNRIKNATQTYRQSLDLFLTMTACNIQSEDGKPLFQFGDNKRGKRAVDSQSEFDKKLCLLDPTWVDEMYDRCLFVNPDWGESAYIEDDDVVLDTKGKK